MKYNSNSHYFWVSFTDLMITLFFVVLVLYVITQKKIGIEANLYKKIKETYTSIKKISNNKYFEYNEKCQRYELKQDIQFDDNKSIIHREYYQYLTEAGKILEQFIREQESAGDIDYIVIIEGRAAKISSYPEKNLQIADFARNLSHRRAIAIKEFWEKQGIQLASQRTDLIIAGNGHEGLCRYSEDKYDREEEDKNKRFVIQIIPHIKYLYKEEKL